MSIPLEPTELEKAKTGVATAMAEVMRTQEAAKEALATLHKVWENYWRLEVKDALQIVVKRASEG